VTVRIGGERLEALYAGASGDLAGLDQINLSLPRTLAGRGFFATDSWKWAYPYLIDADSWVDYTLLTELSMNGDGYLKSFYFHTQVTDQCRFTPLVMGPPWDFDLAFGNSGAETWNDGLKSPACRIDGHLIYPGSDRMPHLAKLWGDQRFQRKLKERWQALRQNTLSESNIMTLIDDDSRSTVRSREADRNLWKSKFPNLPPRDGSDWPAPCYRGVTTLSGEVQALKDFIRLRLQFMDRYLGSF
ncbi:MAG: CotH kinase family protein, partial [Blastocatellia bacterium]